MLVHGTPRTLILVTLFVVSACGVDGGEAPVLSPIDNQVVAVGDELVVLLEGSDPEGGTLRYAFESLVPDIRSRADITVRPNGVGAFRWRPQATDVGSWFFDFSVSDGSSRTTQTVQIDVKSAVGRSGAPVFREPLGSGTTLDLDVSGCIAIHIAVEDQDSTAVTIAQEEPVIAGATLTSFGGLVAQWEWCPTIDQVAADDRYTLVLSADDGEHPKTVKNYLIVLRRPVKPGCPGEPPVVHHTSQNVDTVLDVPITARVTDDLGLKRVPLLYYSFEPPVPLDLASMDQVEMAYVSGDIRDGQWEAAVPNPVANAATGATASIYYVVVATDDDDEEGACDHVTQAPEDRTYQMTVTNPGGGGGAGVCEPCTADVQCGTSSDLCVIETSSSTNFCLQGCSAGDCPDGFSCSSQPITSVDGTARRQCVPTSGSCVPAQECVDDALEDNDGPTQANANPALDFGVHSLVMCSTETADDEDWFRVDYATNTGLSIAVEGGSATDIDLSFVNAQGNVVGASRSPLSSERLAGCVPAGSYYLRVQAFGAGTNPYTLSIASSPELCQSATCEDDDYEDDDDRFTARVVDLPGSVTFSDNAICKDDEDWFRVILFAGERITINATFDHAAGDLDMRIVDRNGNTPCSRPADCAADSVTSNERMALAVHTTGTYFVIVRGWEGAENEYDITFDLE